MSDLQSPDIDRLIDAVVTNPTRLPLREIAAVHQSGRELRLRATVDRVVAVVSPRRDARLASLTEREREVATLVSAGYTNRQIGVALNIRLGTVKDHVHSILAKTGFDSRGQLIAAWYGGLVD